jgi:(1->4)-alpha-D-glucan 1-alpha-D-glucosylmutase
MAKGLEDTAFYRYNRLVSLNDVGGDLHRFGFTTAEFHSAGQERLRSHPHTMLATSTHDSKRSEDVRARINVLSEVSGLWRLRLRDWKRFNRRHKRLVNDKPAPSPNDEYLLYQTLVGAWPIELSSESRPTDWKTFNERIESYMLKAIREAKQNTSWINRNTEYEEAVSFFVKALLDRSAKNRFRNDFVPFQRRVARIGLWNSLSQTLLKLTSPGVPDIYQGNELWDLSLVDPDNRRTVNYHHRRELFNAIHRRVSAPDASSIGDLMETPEDGRIKLYLIWKALCLRQQYVTLFQEGEYLPLAVTGAKANHVIAFARKVEGTSVIVIVPRLIATLLNDVDVPPTGPQIWQDTHVLFPCDCREKCENVLTGKELELVQTEDRNDGHASGLARISVSAALAEFPVALCLLNQPS